MATFRTGGEADSFCTRCRMVLAHTILALEGGKPARVECNTCHGQHNYRPGTPDARSAPAAVARADGDAKAGRTRGKDFQIIITPPIGMPIDEMQAYAAMGVDRLVVNLGSQRPEGVDARLKEIGTLVKRAG